MHSLTGGCHCGNLRVELALARSPASYHPRVCDCDFCRKHAAEWISDPEGSLQIVIGQNRGAGRYRQGSGLAELLFCANCGILVAALLRGEQRLHAAVNARILAGKATFAPPETVTPQVLSGREKVERWQRLWFADVRVV